MSPASHLVPSSLLTRGHVGCRSVGLTPARLACTRCMRARSSTFPDIHARADVHGCDVASQRAMGVQVRASEGSSLSARASSVFLGLSPARAHTHTISSSVLLYATSINPLRSSPFWCVLCRCSVCVGISTIHAAKCPSGILVLARGAWLAHASPMVSGGGAGTYGHFVREHALSFRYIHCVRCITNIFGR